jgi:hypothetical protein
VTGLPPPTSYYGGKARLAGWIASAVATEVIWSNRPLTAQARLLDPTAGFSP